MDENMKLLLLGSYFLGFAAAFYLGMRFQARLFRKHRIYERERAYDRGWEAGYNFVGTIHDRKVDMESAVRILTGEELQEDRPFPRS